jgi:hypothetical protein
MAPVGEDADKSSESRKGVAAGGIDQNELHVHLCGRLYAKAE